MAASQTACSVSGSAKTSDESGPKLAMFKQSPWLYLARSIERTFAVVRAPASPLELARWYETEPGQALLAVERTEITALLDKQFGYHILQIGGGREHSVIESSAIAHKLFLCGQEGGAELQSLRANPAALPLASDSVDVIVLHHALEFSHDSRAVLREAVRILRPGGRLVMLSFQPFSLWGLKHSAFSLLALFWRPLGRAPWAGRYHSTRRLHDWLELLDVQVERTVSAVHGLPIESVWLRGKLASVFLWCEERGGSVRSPFGAVRFTSGIKQARPVIPISTRWRQPLRPRLGGLSSPVRGQARQGRV